MREFILTLPRVSKDNRAFLTQQKSEHLSSPTTCHILVLMHKWSMYFDHIGAPDVSHQM